MEEGGILWEEADSGATALGAVGTLAVVGDMEGMTSETRGNSQVGRGVRWDVVEMAINVLIRMGMQRAAVKVQIEWPVLCKVTST